jgi:hypothetical protein
VTPVVPLAMGAQVTSIGVHFFLLLDDSEVIVLMGKFDLRSLSCRS